MEKNTKYVPPLRPLHSIAAAAMVSGLSPKMLTAAIENGDIPGVRILTLGPCGMRHVRNAPFLTWVEGVEDASILIWSRLKCG